MTSASYTSENHESLYYLGDAPHAFLLEQEMFLRGTGIHPIECMCDDASRSTKQRSLKDKVLAGLPDGMG
jgi:hypothetical protein